MRELGRTLGDYCILRDQEPPFGPSDAIALGLLVHRAQQRGSKEMEDFYQRGFSAVCAGLGLEGGPFLDAFDWSVDDVDREERARRLVIEQIGRLRLAMTVFCDEWGDVLEGDVWGKRIQEAFQREPLVAAERWYESERARMLEGAATFDAALFALLGWNTTETVPLELLRSSHGYPAADEYEP